MRLEEYIRANPEFLQRAMRCDNTEELHRLVRLEGIEASPEDVDYAASLVSLGDHELEAVAGGKGMQPAALPLPTLPGGAQLGSKVLPPPTLPGGAQLGSRALPSPTLPGTPLSTGSRSSWSTNSMGATSMNAVDLRNMPALYPGY